MAFKERHLVEEVALAPILWAGLGGMVGSGLDSYLKGDATIGEALRPMAAWGVGGALGGLGSILTNTGTKTIVPASSNINPIKQLKA